MQNLLNKIKQDYQVWKTASTNPQFMTAGGPRNIHTINANNNIVFDENKIKVFPTKSQNNGESFVFLSDIDDINNYRLRDGHEIDSDEGLINFYIENYSLSELINAALEAVSVVELINAALEANKLQELIDATTDDNKNKVIEYSNLNQLTKIVSLENLNEDFKNKLNEKIENYRYKQYIIYGPAGVGKTYSIRATAIDELGIADYEKHTIHTVFHPESSYYDFFGKVMPVKKSEGISYDFLPGPFAQTLEKAYNNIKANPVAPEKVLLVIDELNRGNAASIFGGLFNLLDRNDNGVSEYPLNIYGMEANWLNEKISSNGGIDILNTYVKKYTELNSFSMISEQEVDEEAVNAEETANQNMQTIESMKIFIPHNLSIICTMNTSDQTIFSLDKAFQRRFDKEFKTAQMSIDTYGTNDDESEVKIERIPGIVDTDIVWKGWLAKLNKFIVKNADIDDVDNATIGAYFVKKKDGEIKIEDIKYTIMYYLWYDLFSGWKRADEFLNKLGVAFNTDENKPKSFEKFTEDEKVKEFIEAMDSVNDDGIVPNN